MLETRIFLRFIQKKKKKNYRSLKKYWRGSSERKIYRKKTNGRIIEEKSYTTNAFLWEKISK
jgi:hypothetical protein